ncbi:MULTISPECIES: GDYXXLXY domain-containing protein [unclassified Shinella]|uniref:GDYXXLXY domain-containing protein n=1 Tax=unclassified Shinella TaxID=2643062 RepID=UPI00234E8194|nr:MULTISPECIES: GDYXXLXY domain-containing protein [unclassified Shinella]MCO5152655.1 GDYXXLXY domain-containing protein [Shinella sp.]MDC7261950.1 GDYXXLXY domain-containing protein [Shinella sp. HY16]MDC7268845.1 GDYXXLXY domain-containing protein [Shinella sp. YZ44]
MTLSRFLRVPPLVAGILAAALQTAVLGYMVESRASILRSGADIKLKTLPVDPRDLLRGDYVILSYPISTIPKAIVTGDVPKASGRVRLAVRLKPGADGLWTANEARFGDLAPEEGSVILRTLPFDYYSAGDGSLPDTLFVSYGLERYYVPEGEGRVLEDARNQEELEVEARVSADGTPQIARLILRGEPIYDEPLY